VPYPNSYLGNILTNVVGKARIVYPFIPLQSLYVATKRVQAGTLPSASDPWIAAIFHTGWKVRLVIQTCRQVSRSKALENMLHLLDDTHVGEYEWFELSNTNTNVREFELVRNIKSKRRKVSPEYRLSCFQFTNLARTGMHRPQKSHAHRSFHSSEARTRH
jgi:hypothetical protein